LEAKRKRGELMRGKKVGGGEAKRGGKEEWNFTVPSFELETCAFIKDQDEMPPIKRSLIPFR